MTIEYHVKDLHKTAVQFWDLYPNATCIAFNADMGAGKTTFISALGKCLGIQEAMSSPTFSIVNEYEIEATKQKVYHLDLYRLKGIEDAIEAGVQDILEAPDTICFIEWPGVAPELLPKHTLYVSLEIISNSERRWVVQ